MDADSVTFPGDEPDCDCHQCRLMDAIFTIASGGDDHGACSFYPEALAIDLLPTLGLIASHLSPNLVDRWLSLIIEARLHALDPEAAHMPPIQGRA